MNDLLPFLVIGVTTGAVYGLAALGLVLTYKSSGIFNFAHGAIAALSAYAYYQLHVIWGLPRLLAVALAAIVVPPLVGLVMERVARGLAGGTVTAKIVGTVGLQLAITSALLAHFGGAALPFPNFLPTETVRIVGVNVGIDQLIAIAVAGAGAGGMYVFFRRSALGARMRAVVDDPQLLGLSGANVFAVRSWAWLIGCWFAGISGLLLAPRLGLDPLLLSLLVVQAYGAAAVGLFSSLPLTFAGGLLIGVLAAMSTKVALSVQWLAGLPSSVPFLVLFAVLLLVPRGKLVQVGGLRAAAPRRPLVSPRGALVISCSAFVLALFIPALVGAKLPVYSQALAFVVIMISLYLLVGISGQVSLAHAGLVAVGAAAFSKAAAAGVPWLLAVLLAGVATVPIGVLVAVPAIRLSGLFLALATFGFGLLLEQLFYRTDLMFGATDNVPAPRPSTFSSDESFYYVLLVFAVLAGLLLMAISRARLGRMLRALSESPTALSTLGLGVNVTRVTVFGVSAFVAGIGGALVAAQGQSVSGNSFLAVTSLGWLAVLFLSSPARSAAPVLAALGLVVAPAYINSATWNEWLPVFFGLGALFVAVSQSTPRSAGLGRDVQAGGVTDRVALRLSSRSPVRQRLEDAASGTTSDASSEKELVMGGSAR